MLPSPSDPPVASDRARVRRGRRLAKGLGLGVISLAVALVGGEFAYRALDGEPLPDVIGPRYLFERDSELGIRLRPGFRGIHRTHEFEVEVTIDGMGLRDREVDDVDPAAFRILSLGDSFAYGFGVSAEETYSRRLEEILGRERRVRVFNAGAPSYGTRHELVLLRRLAPELEPDLVLLSFFFANDLQDNVAPLLTERGGVVLSPHFAEVVDSSWLYTFALEHSDLLTVGILRWRQISEGLEIPAPPTRPPADPVAVIETPPGLDVLAVAPSAEREASWRETASLLRAIRDATRAAGARLVILDCPLRYQLDDALWARMAKRHGFAPGDFDRGASSARLRAIASELAVPFLSLADALAEEPDPAALYFAINKHFTAAGHAAAGRAIAAFLAREGLLDG